MNTDTYHHGDLRSALLEAVGEIVAERGFIGVSLREAARRAGVSHSAPAHHFGDKEGLLDAYAVEGFELLAARFDDAVERIDPDDSIEYVDALGRTYLTFAVEDPAHYAVMFGQRIDHEDRGSALSDAADACFDRVIRAVELLVRDEIVAADDARYVATMLWATVHGIAVLWNDGKLPHFYEDHTFEGVRDGVAGVIRGLLASQAA